MCMPANSEGPVRSHLQKKKATNSAEKCGGACRHKIILSHQTSPYTPSLRLVQALLQSTLLLKKLLDVAVGLAKAESPRLLR